MGHITHLRNHFKSINIWFYIITLIKRRKNPLSPFWELNGPYLSNLKSLSPKDALCKLWLILAQWFWRRRFLNLINFVIISSWKRAWPFIWTNLNSLHPRMLCSKFGWNWPGGSGEDQVCFVLGLVKIGPGFWRRFLNILNIILYFRYYLPLERGMALYLNKLEYPPPKDALCQVWLILAQWFWLSLIHIWRCRRYAVCRSRWSPYH